MPLITDTFLDCSFSIFISAADEVTVHFFPNSLKERGKEIETGLFLIMLYVHMSVRASRALDLLQLELRVGAGNQLRVPYRSSTLHHLSSPRDKKQLPLLSLLCGLSRVAPGVWFLQCLCLLFFPLLGFPPQSLESSLRSNLGKRGGIVFIEHQKGACHQPVQGLVFMSWRSTSCWMGPAAHRHARLGKQGMPTAVSLSCALVPWITRPARR